MFAGHKYLFSGETSFVQEENVHKHLARCIKVLNEQYHVKQTEQKFFFFFKTEQLNRGDSCVQYLNQEQLISKHSEFEVS